MSSSEAAFKSCLYKCRVFHERQTPVKHRFSYGVFMFLLDLDELDALDRSSPLFGNEKFALFSFKQEDHLKGYGLADAQGRKPSLKERLRLYVESELGEKYDFDRVHLLTYPRVLGYVFNPVSFYFLHRADKLCKVIIEVSNTFGEMKIFSTPTMTPSTQAAAQTAGHTDIFSLRAPKNFYVSPYGRLQDYFDFKINEPGDVLNIAIDTVSDGRFEKVMLSTLSGRKLDFKTSSLLSLFLLYPFVTVKVIAMIHIQALLLFLKKVPFFEKDQDLHLQTDVMNPRVRKIWEKRV